MQNKCVGFSCCWNRIPLSLLALLLARTRECKISFLDFLVAGIAFPCPCEPALAPRPLARDDIDTALRLSPLVNAAR